MSPLANSYLSDDQVDQPETFFPLHARVCSNCFLVQVGEFERPDAIFTDYAYFSSYSQSWLDHARAYVQDVISRFSLDRSKQVVEIASNDGYLLKNFVAAGIPAVCFGPGDIALAHSAEEFVPVDEARRILEKASEPKRLWVIQASDHRFSDNLGEFDRRLLEACDWVRQNAPH